MRDAKGIAVRAAGRSVALLCACALTGGVLAAEAGRGDPAALYNLALEQDGAQRGALLSEAAAGRLEAARRLLVGQQVALVAAQPAPPLDRELWLRAQAPARFTLQLASSRSEAAMRRLIEDNGLGQQAGYYKSLRDGDVWFALVYGSYPTLEAARAAVAELPPGLQQWSPWIRRFSELHRVMDRHL